MNATIGDFGRASGLDGLSLNERGAAALRFETGVTLRLEYTGAELVMSVAVSPVSELKRLFAVSHPKARYGFKIRSGVLPKTQEGVLAIRLAERDVTLPQLNAAFGVLWRLAGEVGGVR
jgi:type III secretion system chaperone SycN